VTQAPGAAAPAVEIAQLGPIDDQLLNRIRDITIGARAGCVTDAEAELAVRAMPAICDELLQRRRIMATIAAAASHPDNVVFLDDRR
jgi:hypothetical protein